MNITIIKHIKYIFSGEQRFLTDNAATGGRYIKAVFREYTDGTFTKLKRQTYRDRHRGFIGPVIRVEVGERLEVIFKNKASRQYSFHPFGLPVKKKYEGALYKNDRSSKLCWLNVSILVQSNLY